MADLANTRLPNWVQPTRPDWVKQVNEEGRHLDIGEIVPLDAASLIASAMSNTGLDDFGDDDWREPFAVLIKALNEEAELTLTGRILTRADLISFLEARLKVEDLYNRHPEVEDEVIDKPFIIIGQGRSGTTYLQKLMSLPPRNRTMTDLDGLWPIREPDEEEAYAERAFNRMRMWSRIVPQVEAIHDFHAGSPCETIRFEAFAFRCPAWLNLLGVTPSFNAYVAQTSQEISLTYARRVLKAQQFLQPGRQWVLKSPDALLYLPVLLKVFPDARLVWGHRDPIKAMSSMVDMIGTMTFIRSDRKQAVAYEQITNPALVAPLLSTPIDQIESGAVPADRLCNVQYNEMTADPVGTIESVYAFFGEPFTPEDREAIESYVRQHPRTKRPAHQYATGHDEQVSRERAAFRRYQDYFGVADEF